MQAHDILLAQARAEANAASALVSHLQPAEAGSVAEAGTLLWAKAWGTWRNVAGNASYVDAWPCADKAGASPVTPTIRIYLPRTPGTDPNVVMNQVLAYIVDGAGENIAVAGYLDEGIGSVKIWSKTTALPAGWVECAPYTGASTMMWPLAGSFPVGKKAGDADFATQGNSGNAGRKTHSHDLVRDPADPPALPVSLVEGQWSSLSIGAELANHLPPWCVVRFIERIDNSV